MKNKIIYMSILFIFGLIVSYFFLFSNSYSNSLKARFYYTIGEYNKAYNLSREVYLKNSYNTMALTIMTQSKIAISYKNYIKEAKTYLKEIEKIGDLKHISKKDLIKIKMICEIMMGKYKNLKPSVLGNKELSDQAAKLYKKFENIYNELF